MDNNNKEEKLNLKEVYKDLTDNSLIRTPRINKILRTFANLLGIKPSFSSRVHTEFKKLVT